MKFKIKITSILAITALFFISCKKDFLEVADKTKLLKQAYVTDLETTGQYLNGVYVNMASKYVYGSNMVYGDFIADDMKTTSPARASAYYQWAQQANVAQGSFSNMNEYWLKLYGMIRDCSYVIEKAEEFKKENGVKANDLKGQAYGLRAMFHFSLVNIFAQSFNFTSNGNHPGIPYISSSAYSGKSERLKVSEVYDHIISDLNQASALLKSSNDKEVFNQNAAKALLAKVYLFQEDFAQARKFATSVLKDIPIDEDTYFQTIFSKNDKEPIFRIPPGASEADRYTAIFTGYYSNPKYELWFVATSDIVQLLREEVNDKRKNWVEDKVLPNSPTVTTHIIKKFPDGATGLFVIPEGDHYCVLLRSTDMALIASEAYAKGNMPDSARFYVNKIRQRAGVAPLDNSVSGTELFSQIQKERRKEMCFEGGRMFDLLRWKQGVNRQDSDSPSAQNLPYPSNKAIAPLPLNDVNVGGLSQNPGY